MYKVLENILPMNTWKKLLENLQHSMSYETKQWAKASGRMGQQHIREG